MIGRDAALAENVQLRKLVNLDQNVGADAFQPIAARVIARSPTLWYATLNIDKGSNAGVHLDDPVMNGDGLVGRISDVTGNAARGDAHHRSHQRRLGQDRHQRA